MKVCCIFILQLFACLLVHSQDNPRADALLAEADLLINRQAYEQALEKIEEVLEMESSYVPAEKKKINVYILKDNYKEAASLVEEALVKYPRESVFYYFAGVIHLQKRKFQKAIENFDLAMETDDRGELSRIFLNRGMANFNLQEYDEALMDMSKSIEFDPDNYNAFHGRGMAYYEMRDYTSAMEDFKVVIENTDDNPVTYYNLAMSYFRLDDIKNACIHFNKACRLGNRNACRMIMMECVDEINIPR